MILHHRNTCCRYSSGPIFSIWSHEQSSCILYSVWTRCLRGSDRPGFVVLQVKWSLPHRPNLISLSLFISFFSYLCCDTLMLPEPTYWRADILPFWNKWCTRTLISWLIVQLHISFLTRKWKKRKEKENAGCLLSVSLLTCYALCTNAAVHLMTNTAGV